MKPVVAQRVIEAPRAAVFQAVSDPIVFQKAASGIKGIEFLSEQHSGPGTRFKETRVMHGKEGTVELEITEHIANDRVRLVSDAGNTIWDTLFQVRDEGDSTVLSMQMDVRPYTFMARIMNRLIRGHVVKGIESDMDAIKAFCEAGNPSD